MRRFTTSTLFSSKLRHQPTSKITARRAAILSEALEKRTLFSTLVVNDASGALNDGAGKLTLEGAVAQANATSSADTITFAASAFPANQTTTINLSAGDLSPVNAGALTITGPTNATVVVQPQSGDRIFFISSGASVTVSNLTLQGVNLTAGSSFNGGAIYNAGTLTLNNVFVSGNIIRGASLTGGGGFAEGAGIYSSGSLTLNNSSVQDNQAIGGAGVTDSNNPTTAAPGGLGAGGGIYSTGSLTLNTSDISGNSATGGAGGTYGVGGIGAGGGIYSAGGSLTITNSSIDENSVRGGDNGGNDAAGAAEGGGVYTTTNYNISGGELSRNDATGGNGPSAVSADSPGGDSFGGALYSTASTGTVNDVELQNNVATGGDAAQIDGGPGDASGGAIYSTKALSVINSVLNANTVTGGVGEPGGFGRGGGIFAGGALTVTGDIIENNRASGGVGNSGTPSIAEGDGSGGGVYSTSTLTVLTSTISGNTATGGFGQYGYGQDGGLGVGGGVDALGASTITESTFSTNSAVGGHADPVTASEITDPGHAGVGGGGEGGAFADFGGLTLIDSTFYKNTASGGNGGNGNGNTKGGNGGNGTGGGVYSKNTLTIEDSTITGNSTMGGSAGAGGGDYAAGTAGSGVGSGIAILSGTTLLKNTIVSGDSNNTDITGTASSSSGFNLIGTGGGLTNGSNGNKTGITNPQLGTFGTSGGGLTNTLLPNSGSPAIDAGSNSLIPSGLTVDQRGLARISGSAVDIGADETVSTATGGSISGTVTGGQTGETIYVDANNNNQLDSGEIKTTTSSSGTYTLTHVPAGAVIVRQVLPSGYTQTTPSGGLGVHVTVTNGGSATNENFIDKAPSGGSISGTVTGGQTGETIYVDANNNSKFDSGELHTTTSSSGSYSISNVPAGAVIVRQVLPTGYTQTTPSGGLGVHVTVTNGGSSTNENFVDKAPSKLSGTTIGTSGSANNAGNTIAKATDGNLSTFFDGPTANGCWVGLDLGSSKSISQIEYAARSGFGSRMTGGKFQISTSANFSSGVTTLTTITGSPASGSLTTFTLSSPVSARYVRYLSPDDSYGNIAEFQVFG